MTNTINTNTSNTNTITITPDYYDSTTYTMLLETLTEDDKEYINNTIDNTINNTTETIETHMFRRWSTIINSLPHHYYHHYSTQVTQQDRNDWFKKYLDYPTKNILDMTELL